jgi:hypothetical protein
LDDASAVIERSVLSRGRKASGGDLVLSGVGRTKAATLGVSNRRSQDLKSTTIQATGPWQFVEFDTSPRVITSRYGGGSRRSRAAALGAASGRRVRFGVNRVYVGSIAEGLQASGAKVFGVVRIPGVGYRRYARVRKGSRGTAPFRKGIDDGLPEAVRQLRQKHIDITRKVLR